MNIAARMADIEPFHVMELMAKARAVPPPIVWTHFCNSGRLSHCISLSDFNG